MFSLGAAVQATTLTGVIVQDTEPAITDRDKVWIRTSGGAPVSPPVWIFFNGQWVAKHPVAAGTLWALPYTGTVASIATLDGGSAGAVSDDTGPFWEAVASLAGRFPIGAGTLPSGTALAVGDTGGEEKHVLAINEMPAHSHVVDFGTQNMFGVTLGFGPPPLRISSAYNGVQTGSVAALFNTNDAGSGDGHQNMPPYLTLTFLKRTARIYCTAPIV